ncbi:hypothetical protein IWQ49_004629 [Labrenzia sp. EL_126]|nr:hypothetical protein [Labrenzia sp. EL_126]
MTVASRGLTGLNADIGRTRLNNHSEPPAASSTALVNACFRRTARRNPSVGDRPTLTRGDGTDVQVDMCLADRPNLAET